MWKQATYKVKSYESSDIPLPRITLRKRLPQNGDFSGMWLMIRVQAGARTFIRI